MSQENVEIGRRLLDAWNRWVFEDIASFYAPDTEIVSPGSQLFGRTYRGHDGLRQYIDDFSSSFDRPVFELEEILDAGGQTVVSVVRVQARGTQSGVEVHDRTANVFTIASGLISRQVIYMDRSAALKAVGLQ